MHRFNPDHHARLDDPQRIGWQDPSLLLPYLALEPNSIIVDVGSGTGFFTIPIAESKPQAQVIGADISSKMADLLTAKAAERNLDNMSAVVLEGSRLPFADKFADVVLIANVLHEFDKPNESLAEIRRILKPGGRLVIVDWDKKDTPVGPPIGERISKADATETAAANGFSNVISPEIYPYSYVLVCS